MKKLIISSFSLVLIFSLASCKFSADYMNDGVIGAESVLGGEAGGSVSAAAQPEAGEAAQPEAGEVVQPEAGEVAQPETGETVQPDTGEPVQPEAPVASKLAISNMRLGASKADIEAGKASTTLKSGTAPVIAFDIPADLSIASVDISKGVIENGKEIVRMDILDCKPSSVEGNTCIFDYPHLFTIEPIGASFFKIVAKDELGQTATETITLNIESNLEISNMRFGASAADIKAGKVSTTLKSGTAPVIAFDIPADLSIASVDIFKGVVANGKQNVLMAIRDYKPSSVEGNTCVFDYPHLFTIDPIGTSFFKIVAKDKSGQTVTSTITMNVVN